MQENVNGINEEKLDKLIIDISNYADSINNTLNSIDELVSGIQKEFECTNSKKFRDHFLELRNNFKTVNKNILSYVTDLAKVKISYKDRVDKLVNKVNSARNDM